MVDLKVKDIMIKEVMFCDYSDRIVDVADFMYKKGIGSILVNKNGVPEGIMTERDIVHNCLMGSQNVFNNIVGGIMSEPVICINEESTVLDACHVMRDRRIKKLVVIGSGEKIVGVITMTDIVKCFPKIFDLPDHAIDVFVHELMIKDIFFANAEDLVVEISLLMKRHNIGSIMIMENDVPSGIITERDIVRSCVLGDVNFYKLKAKDIMSRRLITLNKGKRIMDVAQVLNERHIKKVIVVEDDDSVCGIITQTDLTYNIDLFLSLYRPNQP